MYERSYGDNYDGDRPVKADAALIRAEIKAKVKAGELPADWKYSVRYRTASMCRAIDITATAPRATVKMAPDMIFGGPDGRVVTVPAPIGWDEDYIDLSLRPNEVYEIRWCDAVTDEARNVGDYLRGLLSSYNHDGSDSMIDYFDVKFYGVPTIVTADGVDRFERPAPTRTVSTVAM